MSCRLTLWPLVLAGMLLGTFDAPAPLIYTPGEGWSYEFNLSRKWRRERAEDQLQVAKDALKKGNLSLARKAARRTIRQWPLSDFSPEAQALLAQVYAEKGWDKQAFDEYAKLLRLYPKFTDYKEVQSQQFDIANRFLNGQRFRVLFNKIPLYRSMKKTAAMFEQIVQVGPYSDMAAQAQLNIGGAWEKNANRFRFSTQERNKDFNQAIIAYRRAADRYHDHTEIASTAYYRTGLAYQKQSRRAEYDQEASIKSIEAFSDFSALFEDDTRLADAQKRIAEMELEQARGNMKIARFYEKRKLWKGARIYYNEVAGLAPNSAIGQEAKQKVNELRPKAQGDDEATRQ